MPLTLNKKSEQSKLIFYWHLYLIIWHVYVFTSDSFLCYGIAYPCTNISGSLIVEVGQWIRMDQFHKSQNTPAPYPTIIHSEQKCAHFCSEWCIVGYETGAFWDLWIRSVKHTKAWRTSMPLNWVIIGSGNGLMPVSTSPWPVPAAVCWLYHAAYVPYNMM